MRRKHSNYVKIENMWCFQGAEGERCFVLEAEKDSYILVYARCNTKYTVSQNCASQFSRKQNTVSGFLSYSLFWDGGFLSIVFTRWVNKEALHLKGSLSLLWACEEGIRLVWKAVCKIEGLGISVLMNRRMIWRKNSNELWDGSTASGPQLQAVRFRASFLALPSNLQYRSFPQKRALLCFINFSHKHVSPTEEEHHKSVVVGYVEMRFSSQFAPYSYSQFAP